MHFNWYVITECKVKNNGREEIFYTTVAGFQNRINAEDFIKFCIQDELKFKVVPKWDLEKYNL